jgi:hypothetical protein
MSEILLTKVSAKFLAMRNISGILHSRHALAKGTEK